MKKALFSLLLTIACLPMAFGQRPANVQIEDTTITACGSYTWIDGVVYTHDTIVTYLQDDSVLHVLDLTVTAPSIDTATATPHSGGCSVEWNNKTWNTPGIYLDTIRATAVGQCDNVVKIEIILTGTDTIEAVAESACGFFVTSWGDTIKTSVSAVDTTISTEACGLTIGNLNITIHQADTADTEVLAMVEGCSMQWNGIEVKVPDSVYYYTMPSVHGCDSVVSVKVTAFSGSTYDTVYVSACDFYVLEDDTIRTSTFVTEVDSSGACPAYLVTAITIHPSYRDTASVVVRNVEGGCNLVWHGRTYLPTDSAFLDTTLLAIEQTVAGGCDSLVAIRITGFSFVQDDTTTVDYCGDRYIWRNGNDRDTIYRDGGDTERIHTSLADGCTTNKHLFITFHDVYDTINVDSVCASYTYLFDSRAGVAGAKDTAVFTETGTHSVDQNGRELYSTHFSTRCVTHHAVIVKIKEPEQRQSGVDIDTVVCDEFRFTFNNINLVWTESADSILVNSRRTMRSCYDMYGHVKLTVNKRAHDTIVVDTCDFWTWRGYNDETYNRSTRAEMVLPDTTTADGCRIVAHLNLTINYTPHVTIEGDWMLEKDSTDETTLTAVCDEPVRYKWYKNGVAQSETSNTLHVTGINDNVDIHLESTSNNGCVAHNWITITYNVGIDETDAVAVNIYPNPATRYINIESAVSMKDIVIFNAIGQQVVNNAVDGNRTTLDLGSLASGTYTLRITAANGEQVTRKFIVNK